MKCIFIYNPNSGSSKKITKKLDYIKSRLNEKYDVVDVQNFSQNTWKPYMWAPGLTQKHLANNPSCTPTLPSKGQGWLFFPLPLGGGWECKQARVLGKPD